MVEGRTEEADRAMVAVVTARVALARAIVAREVQAEMAKLVTVAAQRIVVPMRAVLKIAVPMARRQADEVVLQIADAVGGTMAKPAVLKGPMAHDMTVRRRKAQTVIAKRETGAVPTGRMDVVVPTDMQAPMAARRIHGFQPNGCSSDSTPITMANSAWSSSAN
jgi:hypothetical protein